jgi:hypothetical protein
MRYGETSPSRPRMQDVHRHGALLLSFRCNILLLFHPVPLQFPDATCSVICCGLPKASRLRPKVWYVVEIVELFWLLYVPKVVAYIVTSESRQLRLT